MPRLWMLQTDLYKTFCYVTGLLKVFCQTEQKAFISEIMMRVFQLLKTYSTTVAYDPQYATMHLPFTMATIAYVKGKCIHLQIIYVMINVC